MELKEFIKGVLADIANAVTESQEELKDVAVINAPNNKSGIATITEFYDRHDIKFDIAVMASTEQGKKAGVKVLDAFYGGAATNTTSQQVSRISFSIPVYLSKGQLRDYDRLSYSAPNNPPVSYAEPTAKVERNG